MDVKTSEEKVDLLQKSLVEQRWELQGSITEIGSRMTDFKLEIQLAHLRIKQKMAIYFAVTLFVMVILIKALAVALQEWHDVLNRRTRLSFIRPHWRCNGNFKEFCPSECSRSHPRLSISHIRISF